MIAVSYIVKRKIKKIFFEVISNSKIFNIIFFSTKLSTTKIFPNLQGGTRQRGGLDKGGDWTASNTVYLMNIIILILQKIILLHLQHLVV